MTLVCQLQWTGSAPLNSSRRITERLGSSLQKSSDFCFATHRRPTRAHSRSSVILMPRLRVVFSFASSEGKEQFLHLVRTNEDMGTTTLRMISCPPRLTQRRSPPNTTLSVTGQDS